MTTRQTPSQSPVHPEVAVVIISYNARQYLRRCLRSILHHTRGVSYQVIVVDNASRDGSPQMVATEFPEVKLIARGDNVGFARACNQGIRASQGEFIAILNPDTELQGEVFAPLAQFCRDNPRVAIVGPRIINPDGSLQPSCRRFPGHLTALFNRQSLLTRLAPTNPLSTRYLMTDWDHRRTALVDWVSGACMFIARRALADIGLFDEGFFMYIEDIDLCRRAHKAGYQVAYYPHVTLLHHIGKSSRTLPRRSIIEWHRSMWRYYRKHMSGSATLDAATYVGIRLRCLYQLALQGLHRP